MPKGGLSGREKIADDSKILEGKAFAILGYLSILCIIPLIFKKENAFVLTHSKQGLVIFLGQVGVIIMSILLGQWVFRLGMFVLLILAFAGIVTVLQGRRIQLPIVSGIADKITM